MIDDFDIVTTPEEWADEQMFLKEIGNSQYTCFGDFLKDISQYAQYDFEDILDEDN